MSADDRRALADHLEVLRLAGVRYVRDPATLRPAAAWPSSPAVVPAPPSTAAPRAAVEAPPRAAGDPAEGTGPGTRESLEDVRRDLGDCRRCKLCEGRTNIVFGDGSAATDLVFVGEGPGADEDAKGLPFVGAAGQLLDKIIVAMGLARSDVYICNVVKCRPPKNRQPEDDEVRACSPFMVRQIESIRPRVVCALGATAAQTLTDSREPMGKMRGRLRPLTIGRHETMFLATYHPAYLLRSPDKKRDVWEDVQKVMAFLRA